MPKKKSSKVSVAMAYLEAHPGASKYEAAIHAKMKASPLYAHLKRLEAKKLGVCPCCNQKIAKATP